ncbi:MAG: hypothetical protein LBV08_00145 [Clostridiales bacterium]|jgi:hypothetical protein|nr:hypothetical protein [Clostridiales bacterium]
MPVKKVKTSTAVFVTLAGVSFIVLLLIFSIRVYNQNPSYYNPGKGSKGEKIYSGLAEYDFINAYPETPEEVIEINNKIMIFLYGNILADTSKIAEVLEFQRNIFSDGLNGLNTLESQIENTVGSFNEFSNEGVYVLDVKSGSVKYTSKDDDMCSVILTFYFNNIESIKKQYNLVRGADNKWKIDSWLDL